MTELLIRATKMGEICQQEVVSMIPVLALSPMKGEMCLDLCAAPGSKTTQMLDQLSGEEECMLLEEWTAPIFF